MRYLAQRIGTGEWIDRDLPLSNVERTRDLSGPGSITATIEPELRAAKHTDGLRILEGWATFVYAAEDDGRIRNAGIFVDAQYEESALVATCPGFATYPHGYLYDGEKTWGPQAASAPGKVPVTSELFRPDPIKLFREHWAWIQAQQDSNLGVTCTGAIASTVRVGTNEEPYRLRSYETPDLGEEMDSLAELTPFDYVEEHSWANLARTTVNHHIRVGWPRLGKRRDDLRFALGENVTESIPAVASGMAFANDMWGIGNGEGRTMVRSRSTVRDGRLRRSRVFTDKTMYRTAMNAKVLALRQVASNTLSIESITIIDHPNAPLTAINLGDDIRVQTHIASYGDVDLWLRVTSISEDESGDNATLAVQRSDTFLYSSTGEVSS